MLDKQPSSAPQTDQSAADFRASVVSAFAAGTERMRRIETGLEANTVATSANATAIKSLLEQNNVLMCQNAEMYELFQTMRGGIKTLEWLGRVAKWGAGFAAGTAALCKTMGWWPFSN